MSDIKRVGELEVGQDLPFQKLEWKIERAAWILMALLLLAAVLGLIGPGPLSSATAGEKGSILWAEYNRLERYQSPNEMRVHLGPGAAQGGTTRIWLDREFMESVELSHFSPEPESVEASADRFTYVFTVPDSSQPTAVSIYYEPNVFGKVPVRVGVDGGAELSFWQFYYP